MLHKLFFKICFPELVFQRLFTFIFHPNVLVPLNKQFTLKVSISSMKYRYLNSDS